MQVGAILLLCLVLQLSFSLANERKVKSKRSKILQKTITRHIKHDTHGIAKRSSKKHDHLEGKMFHLSPQIVLPRVKTTIPRVKDAPHGKVKEAKRGQLTMSKSGNIQDIAVKIINTKNNKKTLVNKNSRAKKKTETKRSAALKVAKRSNVNILSEDIAQVLEKGKPIASFEDKLPGGYGEEATNEDEDDDGSGSGGDDEDDDSGSGSSDEESNEKGDSEKSVERDEDDVSQIIKNESAGDGYTGYSKGASVSNNINLKPTKTVQGKGSKRQPKGEWVCRKTCAAPMTFDECANPRCSFKIGTIKDLCYFLCQHQQPTCKEVCKYE